MAQPTGYPVPQHVAPTTGYPVPQQATYSAQPIGYAAPKARISWYSWGSVKRDVIASVVGALILLFILPTALPLFVLASVVQIPFAEWRRGSRAPRAVYLVPPPIRPTWNGHVWTHPTGGVWNGYAWVPLGTPYPGQVAP